MYERYEIETAEAPPVRPVPNKFYPKVGRWGLAKTLIREALHYRFDKEMLLARPCIYGVFSGPLGGFMPRRGLCVGCMRCVQEYPEFCEVLVDERYKALGDSYFGPHAVTTLNYEATTGKIPVKGVGYKGRFAGEGFDAMWTDMSEIVRPTRDGIFGREYISTVVDVGRKPIRLVPGSLAPMGEPLVEIPVPFLFDPLPVSLDREDASLAARRAAERVRTYSIVPAGRIPQGSSAGIAPLLRASEAASLPPGPWPLIEFQEPVPGECSRIRKVFPESVAIARLPLGADTLGRVLELADAGLGSFHLTADYHGRCADGLFVFDAVRRLHEALMEKGVREELTLIVSGGIVRAEHVPKIIIGGADLVALDTPLWVAMGGEIEGEFLSAGRGTMDIPPVEEGWGAQRVVNFCAAWRNQLLEILSAMGLREVRRLRGELGRAIFFEEMEKEDFGDLGRG